MAKSFARTTGLNETIRRIQKSLGEAGGLAAVKGVEAALLHVAVESAHETPRDTSTLVNSQFRNLHAVRGHIVGTLGYSAGYAVYVHNAPGKYLHMAKLRPARGGEWGAHGFYWDPSGNPKFLSGPFEDAVKRGEIVEIIAQHVRGANQ